MARLGGIYPIACEARRAQASPSLVILQGSITGPNPSIQASALGAQLHFTFPLNGSKFFKKAIFFGGDPLG